MEIAPLSNLDIKHFQHVLRARIADLEILIRRRDLIAVERHADAVDEVQHAAERAFVVSSLDRESRQLKEARRALKRIEDGTFGVCEQCGEDIHIKRLHAVPWTAYCIHCQEQMDRSRQEASAVDLDTVAVMEDIHAA